jgi:hypothetical protein
MPATFQRLKAVAKIRGIGVRVLQASEGQAPTAKLTVNGETAYITVYSRTPSEPSQDDAFVLAHELGHETARRGKEEAQCYAPFYESSVEMERLGADLPLETRRAIIVAEIRAWGYGWTDLTAVGCNDWHAFESRALRGICGYVSGLQLTPDFLCP